MKIETTKLTDRALDYAVALAEGGTNLWYDTVATWWITIAGKDRALSAGWSGAQSYMPSTGPDGDDIIDRESISVIRCDDDYATDAKGYTTNKRIPVWAATLGQHSSDTIYGSQGDNYGPAYTLDEVDVVYGGTRREAAMRAWVLKKLGKVVDVPEALV